MYVVTNREYRSDAKVPEKVFGERLNSPNDELRLAVVNGAPGEFEMEIYEETRGMREGREMWPSEIVFVELQERMRKEKRSCVLFVHGFNTSFREALETAWDIEQAYDVEVILFTWPSDGKLTRYRRDKHDAIASHQALDRTLERLGRYMAQHITQQNACKQGFTLLAHSMGNYMLKALFKSSVYSGETLIFDNVVLAAADVNQHDHVPWVNKIQCRNRVYVTINEDDLALRMSQMKFGPKQRTRLGHTVRGAKSDKAVYLDFSSALSIADNHSYFHGRILKKNENVKRVFDKILKGGRCENELTFSTANSCYRVP